MTRIALLLLLAAGPAHALGGGAIAAGPVPVNYVSISPSSIAVPGFPPNSIVFTQGGGVLATVSTLSYVNGRIGLNALNPVEKLHISSGNIVVDGNGVGPRLTLRNSTVNEDNIEIDATKVNGATGSSIIWYAADSTNAKTQYAKIRVTNDVLTDGAETGAMFFTITGGGNSTLIPLAAYGLGVNINRGFNAPAANLHSSSATWLLDGQGSKISVSSGSVAFSPVLTACGTSPDVATTGEYGMTDIGGRFKTGTTPGTACVVTFGISYPNKPICICGNETTAGTAIPRCTATTTLTFNGVFVSGDVLDYHCFGRL